MDNNNRQKLQIAGVGVGVIALLYAIFHRTKLTGSLAGSSVPTLIGSGGDSGGTGLSPIAGDGGATISPLTIPSYDPPAPGSVYAPLSIANLLGSLANPNGNGCCAATPATPYSSVPPAGYPPVAPVYTVDIERGYSTDAQLYADRYLGLQTLDYMESHYDHSADLAVG